MKLRDSLIIGTAIIIGSIIISLTIQAGLNYIAETISIFH